MANLVNSSNNNIQFFTTFSIPVSWDSPFIKGGRNAWKRGESICFGWDVIFVILYCITNQNVMSKFQQKNFLNMHFWLLIAQKKIYNTYCKPAPNEVFFCKLTMLQ